MNDTAYDLRLQVSGDVIPGSIKREGKVVTFLIGEETKPLQVKYVGKDPLPDTLIDRATAMATGKLGHDGVFVADTMLAKCASKYEKETAAGVQISKKSN
jgi:cytochrome c-type biogenesis protein CcmE